MKKTALVFLTLALTHCAFGQVDTESRRTVVVQTAFPLKGEGRANGLPPQGR